MKKAVLFFNGISLPFYVLEYAVKWAKNNESSIHIIFLKGEKTVETGYGFPSDLPIAETITSDEEALDEDEQIIKNNMKLAAEKVQLEDIACTTEIMENPEMDELMDSIADADILVIDSYFDERDSPLSHKISIKDIVEKATCSVQLVSG